MDPTNLKSSEDHDDDDDNDYHCQFIAGEVAASPLTRTTPQRTKKRKPPLPKTDNPDHQIVDGRTKTPRYYKSGRPSNLCGKCRKPKRGHVCEVPDELSIHNAATEEAQQHLAVAKQRKLDTFAMTSGPRRNSLRAIGHDQGIYKCGKCGQLKKGHTCVVEIVNPTHISTAGLKSDLDVGVDDSDVGYFMKNDDTLSESKPFADNEARIDVLKSESSVDATENSSSLLFKDPDESNNETI